MSTNEFPTEGVVLTHLLVVSDMERARHFYRNVLGATLLASARFCRGPLGMLLYVSIVIFVPFWRHR